MTLLATSSLLCHISAAHRLREDELNMKADAGELAGPHVPHMADCQVRFKLVASASTMTYGGFSSRLNVDDDVADLKRLISVVEKRRQSLLQAGVPTSQADAVLAKLRSGLEMALPLQRSFAA